MRISSAEPTADRQHRRTMSCLRDAFAHGRWQHVRGMTDGEALRARNERMECGPRGCAENASSSACVHWEYANASCGAALSEARLCRALRCRNAMLVGDSTMFGLWRALSIFASRTESRPGVPGADYACPSTPPHTPTHTPQTPLDGPARRGEACEGCKGRTRWAGDTGFFWTVTSHRALIAKPRNETEGNRARAGHCCAN